MLSKLALEILRLQEEIKELNKLGMTPTNWLKRKELQDKIKRLTGKSNDYYEPRELK
jgi:hypothetical protein